MPSGKCCGYAVWQAVRHHNADALGVGRALDVEDKLVGTQEQGKLACKLVLVQDSNVVLELGNSSVLVPERNKEQAPQRIQVQVHRQVPVVGTLELGLGTLELELGNKLEPVLVLHRQVLELDSMLVLELGST